MFLSRVTLADDSLKNPYETHRALWRLFPDMPDAERPFLFRVEYGPPRRSLRVLMQSTVCPPVQQADYCFIDETKELSVQLHQGQTLRFALCANPVKRLSKERVRVPLVREEEQLDWLSRKLAPASNLLESHIIARRDLSFRRKSRRGRIATITFAGHLLVEDPDAFGVQWREGIGPAKAFGCGLLSLARA